jgi:uncharacterized protein YdhG (YjbR/CyaY superfamily)
MQARKFSTVDEYISSLPQKIRPIIRELRKTITTTAPEAMEVISYNMPAIRQNGVLVYYAACKDHIGFYPTSSPIIAFKKDLAKYKTSKGAIQFPINEPIPFKLVATIVKWRMLEDREKAALKKKR